MGFTIQYHRNRIGCGVIFNVDVRGYISCLLYGISKEVMLLDFLPQNLIYLIKESYDTVIVAEPYFLNNSGYYWYHIHSGIFHSWVHSGKWKLGDLRIG